MPAENRPEERRILEERAMAVLEDSELTGGEFRRVRVWEYPAFADYFSWIVQDVDFGGSHPKTYTAQQIVWNRTHDLARFADPLEGVRQGFHSPPTIAIRTATRDANVMQPLLHELAAVSIPADVKRETIALDGIQMGVDVVDAGQSLRVVWHDPRPDEWQPFIAVVGRLTDTLRGLFE